MPRASMVHRFRGSPTQDATAAAAPPAAMWKAGGNLAFFFLKLPVEDGPARGAAAVAAVRRLGECLAPMLNSCGLAALLPVKPLFSDVLDAADAVPGGGGAAVPLFPAPLVPPHPARAQRSAPDAAVTMGGRKRDR